MAGSRVWNLFGQPPEDRCYLIGDQVDWLTNELAGKGPPAVDLVHAGTCQGRERSQAVVCSRLSAAARCLIRHFRSKALRRALIFSQTVAKSDLT
jgi:hypothetical protein